MREQAWIKRCWLYATTNEENPDNVRVRNLPTESSFSRARALRFSLPRYQSTERPDDAISSSRDRLLSRTSSRTTYPRKYVSRLSYRSDSLEFSYPPVSLSLSFSFLARGALAGGRRRRKLRNEAPKLPKWPCERCVGRIALLAFSFVRVW